ncbi:glucose-6-phosphate isomerase [Alkalilimnicola ehrlichii MLHE-1]|uniref:Glucose-6-phosphate isomerase n=1 Tax=Alkalilimnicola ehrlichii (strain ATCC BAA-1101 / DSM 17681 / MLHE-1) TaxID=187272 RepID=Q0ABZ2_ALKEH|nr:glucose-6-phosphate isomerase [Alkalilimnicola ehrlichii]ABI55645.1 glucose-6-phosphate isomerase [Alkalilimnicola ehrlichii MLHE-1]
MSDSAVPRLTESAAWQALGARAGDLRGWRPPLKGTQGEQRFRRFSLQLDGLFFDYARQPVDETTRDLLLELARERRLPERIRALFAGEPVNATEGRPALHTLLRAPEGSAFPVHGADARAAVRTELARMTRFVDRVHRGLVHGWDDRPFTDVVNLGIGGSELGAAMAVQALSRFHQREAPRMHFASGSDGVQLEDLIRRLDPATTLFIVASKSFTTSETLLNARAALHWLEACAPEGAHLARHWVGVSANEEGMARFGIPEEQRFRIWDWVGGRYSVASAMGLPVALAVGMRHFQDFLAGMHAMDRHFEEAPLPVNLPVIAGLLQVWSINFLGAHTHCVLPYHQRLARLPAWLQQLEMESLGKRVDSGGRPVDYHTGAVVFGETGFHAQHSFAQLLFQGSCPVAVDFLISREDASGLAVFHGVAQAQALGQGRALMTGRDRATLAGEMIRAGVDEEQRQALLAHREIPGGRPSNTLVFPRLDPYNLGRLIAFYEHRTFVQASIWDINPFDQWGVELGKQLTRALLPAVTGETDPAADLDASSCGLIRILRGAD